MKTDKKCLIVSGGNVDEELLNDALTKDHDLIIAADSGLDALLKTDAAADIICGDFDSAARMPEDIFNTEKIFRFKPEKDSTDTEIAVDLAIEKGCGQILILGATGTRLDHFLGNLAVMAKALTLGVNVIIEDRHNRIRLVNRFTEFNKEDIRGRYVSFIPYGSSAVGVTLRGFKYEITDRDISCFESIGVSNEAGKEEMSVDIRSGMLLMIESED